MLLFVLCDVTIWGFWMVVQTQKAIWRHQPAFYISMNWKKKLVEKSPVQIPQREAVKTHICEAGIKKWKCLAFPSWTMSLRINSCWKIMLLFFKKFIQFIKKILFLFHLFILNLVNRLNIFCLGHFSKFSRPDFPSIFIVHLPSFSKTIQILLWGWNNLLHL